MAYGIVITWLDLTADDLRHQASRSENGRIACRILTIAQVLDGKSREEAASSCGMDQQTLRDWVHRYNASGIDGLHDASRSGRLPILSTDQLQELNALVLAGPTVKDNNVVRWRCIDLRAIIKERFGVEDHERTVSKLLHRIGLSRVQPRPFHPKKDADAQEEFKKNFADHVVKALPPEAEGKTIEIWFQDEARVGQQGTLSYIWTEQGSRPAAVPDNRRTSAYIFRTICPERAVGAAIIMLCVNIEAMKIHLDEISQQIASGAYGIVVCDGAGWHQRSKKLKAPANLSLLTLPPYSPELNPMENVWQYIFVATISALRNPLILRACILRTNAQMRKRDSLSEVMSLNDIARRAVWCRGVFAFLGDLLEADVHVKRILSLVNATLGVMVGASLAVASIGQALAQTRGLVTKHAIKQVY